MKKYLWIFIPILLLVLYFLGPAPDSPELPLSIETPDLTPMELEQQLAAREDTVRGLKDDNESRIVWYGEPYTRTKYVLVYLHGWSASYMEGDPIHRDLARRYGANLFLPRLSGHGTERGDDNFADVTATGLMKSASQALADAHILGDSVIIMGTSTGGTLALYLAGIDPGVSTLILYSPNIRIHDPTAFLLDDPWGLQIARLVTGSDFYDWETSGDRARYWTSHYRLSALGELEALVEETMTQATFKKVQQPAFVGYYYKNDTLKDQTVSVEAIREMFPELSSRRKRLVAFPEAGHHVIGSSLTSGDLASVWQETIDFLDSEAGLSPAVVPVDSAAASTSRND